MPEREGPTGGKPGKQGSLNLPRGVAGIPGREALPEVGGTKAVA